MSAPDPTDACAVGPPCPLHDMALPGARCRLKPASEPPTAPERDDAAIDPTVPTIPSPAGT